MRTVKRRKRKPSRKSRGGAAFESSEPTVTLTKGFFINGEYIHYYKVHCNHCDYYIRDRDNKYIVVVSNQKQYLFRLNDGKAVMLPQSETNALVDTIRKKYDPKLPFQFKKILQDQKIIYFTPGECIHYQEFREAKRKLIELNTILRQKCKHLRLSLDYIYNLDVPTDGVVEALFTTSTDELILCLHNEKGCISSIVLKGDNHTIELLSTTGMSYYQKGYNNLLRCVAMILARFISPEVQTITSGAVNPISAITLLKHFGGYLPPHEKNDGFIEFKQRAMFMANKSRTNTVMNRSGYTAKDYQLIHDYLDQENNRLTTLLVHVDIRDDTSAEYEAKFQSFVDKTVCE